MFVHHSTHYHIGGGSERPKHRVDRECATRSKVALMSNSLSTNYAQRAKVNCHANDEWPPGSSPMQRYGYIDLINALNGTQRGLNMYY